MGDVARLEQEVVRLSQELDQTISEKEQAAQYGLVLLEEKDALEARCQVRHCLRRLARILSDQIRIRNHGHSGDRFNRHHKYKY